MAGRGRAPGRAGAQSRLRALCRLCLGGQALTGHRAVVASRAQHVRGGVPGRVVGLSPPRRRWWQAGLGQRDSDVAPCRIPPACTLPSGHRPRRPFCFPRLRALGSPALSRGLSRARPAGTSVFVFSESPQMSLPYTGLRHS